MDKNKKKCKECGKKFKFKSKKKIFCSDKCNNKNWNKNNPNKKLSIRKRYYYKNPKKSYKFSQNWKKNNKSRSNAYYRNYNLKEENKLMKKIRTLTLQKYGPAKKCKLCNSNINVEHHHFVPYNIDHFIDLCKKCHKELHKKYIG
jgi:hypothetical protein